MQNRLHPCKATPRKYRPTDWRFALPFRNKNDASLTNPSTATDDLNGSKYSSKQRAGASVLPDASLFGVALIWGINIPIMKTGLDQVDAFVFNGLRLIISAIVLAVFAWVERKRQGTSLGRIQVSQTLIYAIVVAALYQLMFLLGIARTTSGNTALIIATVPMWTALMAQVFIGERLRVIAWCGLVIAMFGTIIVAFQKGDVTAGRQQLVGNLIVLAAALMWSAGTVYSRPLLKTISPLQLSATAALIALPMHVLIAVPRLPESMPALRAGDLWLIILYAGVLSSGLALPMWNYGVRHAGAAHAAIIQNLIPLVAILVGWLARNESATGAQLFGGAMILGGLFVMRLRRKPKIELPVTPSAPPIEEPTKQVERVNA